ncbi:hypothetical protein [uncultured Alistipes sp.]|uniref:hypothetical protein n=1 Tax=uncultured Alistipes sp. TaxID=538949 RepID=UPI00320B201A
MRRKIRLYIGDAEADLSTDSLVQMNYKADDLNNPAIVKNSYSQQVTLPSTRNNDAIFGMMFRADRRTTAGSGGTGPAFSPLVRTPFSIYDEAGELLESGYVKLDSVTDKNGSVSYGVTLYGGLGSFFYTLSYDDEGNELTLADLPLLSDDPDDKIEFTINKETVAEAWASLRAGIAGPWQVVNFAPAYNGLPKGDFSADVGVGNPANVGGETSYPDGSNVYRPINNNALYELGEEFTEWQTKDLRSYLQRPVFSVKGMIAAIGRYAASKGFTLKLDDTFFNYANEAYEKAWVTLPLLTTYEREGMEDDFTVSGSADSEQTGIGEYEDGIVMNLNPNNTNTDALVTVTVKPDIFLSTNPDGNPLPSYLNKGKGPTSQGTLGIMIFEQLILYGANNDIVSASPIQVYTSYDLDEFESAADWADKANLPGADYGYGANLVVCGTLDHTTTLAGTSHAIGSNYLQELTASGVGVVKASVRIWVRTVSYVVAGGVTTWTLSDDEPIKIPWYSPEYFDVNSYDSTVSDGTLHYKIDVQLRSDSKITQSIMLSDTMTPAEFLLSYSKTFGLSYAYDKGSKTVSLLTRNSLYTDDVVDIEDRIDRSKEIKTTPLVSESKWLSFASGEAEGDFVEFYRNKYGREYGDQKVNTGYDFNADTNDVLESVEFTGGAEVLEKSIYYNNITSGPTGPSGLNGRTRICSTFLNGAASYKLYLNGSDKDDSVDLEGITPDATATITPFNVPLPAYDIIPKLQCHTDDGSATDGKGILLFLRGSIADDEAAATAYARFIITDDSSAMYDLNGGPCWELSEGIVASDMPIFGRHWMSGNEIEQMMDFGIPAEIDIPNLSVNSEASIYTRYWKNYIEDMYNVDTRICSAYVDFRGIQVSDEMLRKFFFFDGSVWRLNGISNYSLTTVGTVQCEFVKVMDMKAYTEGQIMPYEMIIQLTTDGNDLYVKTSMPLKEGERISILTRGAARSGRMDITLGKRVYKRSSRRWHISNSQFIVSDNGRISVPAEGEANNYRWRIDDDVKTGIQYLHIRKANWSTGFGYKITGDTDRAVTFAVAVVSGKNSYAKEVSNRCYFESRAHIRNGELTQEFVVTK